MANRTGGLESLWRRDLVTLVMRNWDPQEGHGAAVATEWDLQSKGVEAPRLQHRVPSGQPGRLGLLMPLGRIGALLAAHRCWRVLDGDMDTRLVPVPARGWAWLVRRWWMRCAPERTRALAILCQCCRAISPFRVQ